MPRTNAQTKRKTPDQAPTPTSATPRRRAPQAQHETPSPPAALNPALAAELTAVWPELQALASWWQQRQHLAQQDDDPDRKLARQTYHIEQRHVDAVKREADRTGESYAAVVNRAFARYFAGR